MSGNNDRYVAKVLKVVDPFTVIANVGHEHGVNTDDEFLIVGVGEDIVDPDTGEVLERLELVRGAAKVTHVQSRICTLESTAVEQLPDTKEVRRNPIGRAVSQYSVASAFWARSQETATEVVTSGGFKRLPFKYVDVGDCLIKQ